MLEYSALYLVKLRKLLEHDGTWGPLSARLSPSTRDALRGAQTKNGSQAR
jgi:hypothetical protein